MKETEKKKLKDLNLLDRFLFAEAMEDPEILTTLLEIILGKDIVLKHLPQTEKELRNSPLNRMVRLDVWGMDTEEDIYNAEPQGKNTGNLPKRSRLYQALVDGKLLSPGEIDFNKMNNVFIIVISPFDLFGEGLYQYTFQMRCEERAGVVLNDGATRIFLNTHGKNDTEVSPELVELLRYMEHTSEEISEQCDSNRVKHLQKKIEAIKSSEEIGVRYMQRWEELVMERQEGKQEGRQEGLNEGKSIGISEGQDIKLKELIAKKLAKGKDVTIIAEELEEDVETIKKLIEE